MDGQIDSYGLKANFIFETPGGTFTAMANVESQIQGITKAVKSASVTIERANLGGEIGRTATQVKSQMGKLGKAVTNQLSPLKAEFRALKAEVRNIDFGELTDDKQFKNATKEIKNYITQLEKLETQVKKDSFEGREFAASLKAAKTAATSRMDVAKGQREAMNAADRYGTAAAAKGLGESLLQSPLMDFSKEAVNIFAGFDDRMSSVAAITQATGDQLQQLRDKAAEMGNTTRFSSAQAAEAMQYLAMAGFNAEKILKTIPATLSLASAGQLDLAEAADISSNILSGFQMQAEDLIHVSDVLARTSTSANTNVQQMGVAMSYAAPQAKLYGSSLEETSALIGVLSNAGVQADKAGTAIRAAFLRLAAPVKEGRVALDSLGISVVDQSGNMKNIIEVFNELNSKLGIDPVFIEQMQKLSAAGEDSEEAIDGLAESMGQAAKIKTLKSIFGTTALSGVVAGLSQTQELNRLALANLASSVDPKQLEALLTATGQFEQLRKSMSAEEFGGLDVFAKLLRSTGDYQKSVAIIKASTEELEKEGAAGEGAAKRMATVMEDNLAGAFRTLDSAIEAVKIGVIEPLKPLIIGISNAISQTALAFASLPAPIRAVVSGVAVLTVGLAGLLVVGGQAGMMLFGFQQAAATASIASTVLSKSIIPLGGFYQSALLGFQGLNPLTSAVNMFEQATVRLAPSVGKASAAIRLMATSSLAALASPLGIAVAAITGLYLILEFATPQVNVMGAALSGLVAPMGFLVGLVKGIGKGFFGTLLGAFGGAAANAIATPFKIASEAVSQALKSFQDFAAKGEEIGQKIGQAIAFPFQYAGAQIYGLWVRTLNAITGLFKPFLDFLSITGQKFISLLAKNSPGPLHWIELKWAQAIEFIKNLFPSLLAAAANVGNKLVGIFQSKVLMPIQNFAMDAIAPVVKLAQAWDRNLGFVLGYLDYFTATVIITSNVVNREVKNVSDILSDTSKTQAAASYLAFKGFDLLWQGAKLAFQGIVLAWKQYQVFVTTLSNNLDVLGFFALTLASLAQTFIGLIIPGTELATIFSGLTKALFLLAPTIVSLSIVSGVFQRIEDSVFGAAASLKSFIISFYEAKNLQPPTQVISFLTNLDNYLQNLKKTIADFSSQLRQVIGPFLGFLISLSTIRPGNLLFFQMPPVLQGIIDLLTSPELKGVVGFFSEILGVILGALRGVVAVLTFIASTPLLFISSIFAEIADRAEKLRKAVAGVSINVKIPMGPIARLKLAFEQVISIIQSAVITAVGVVRQALATLNLNIINFIKTLPFGEQFILPLYTTLLGFTRSIARNLLFELLPQILNFLSITVGVFGRFGQTLIKNFPINKFRDVFMLFPRLMGIAVKLMIGSFGRFFLILKTTAYLLTNFGKFGEQLRPLITPLDLLFHTIAPEFNTLNKRINAFIGYTIPMGKSVAIALGAVKNSDGLLRSLATRFLFFSVYAQIFGTIAFAATGLYLALKGLDDGTIDYIASLKTLSPIFGGLAATLRVARMVIVPLGDAIIGLASIAVPALINALSGLVFILQNLGSTIPQVAEANLILGKKIAAPIWAVQTTRALNVVVAGLKFFINFINGVVWAIKSSIAIIVLGVPLAILGTTSLVLIGIQKGLQAIRAVTQATGDKITEYVMTGVAQGSKGVGKLLMRDIGNPLIGFFSAIGQMLKDFAISVAQWAIGGIVGALQMLKGAFIEVGQFIFDVGKWILSGILGIAQGVVWAVTHPLKTLEMLGKALMVFQVITKMLPKVALAFMRTGTAARTTSTAVAGVGVAVGGIVAILNPVSAAIIAFTALAGLLAIEYTRGFKDIDFIISALNHPIESVNNAIAKLLGMITGPVKIPFADVIGGFITQAVDIARVVIPLVLLGFAALKIALKGPQKGFEEIAVSIRDAFKAMVSLGKATKDFTQSPITKLRGKEILHGVRSQTGFGSISNPLAYKNTDVATAQAGAVTEAKAILAFKKLVQDFKAQERENLKSRYSEIARGDSELAPEYKKYTESVDTKRFFGLLKGKKQEFTAEGGLKANEAINQKLFDENILREFAKKAGLGNIDYKKMQEYLFQTDSSLKAVYEEYDQLTNSYKNIKQQNVQQQNTDVLNVDSLNVKGVNANKNKSLTDPLDFKLTSKLFDELKIPNIAQQLGITKDEPKALGKFTSAQLALIAKEVGVEQKAIPKTPSDADRKTLALQIMGAADVGGIKFSNYLDEVTSVEELTKALKPDRKKTPEGHYDTNDLDQILSRNLFALSPGLTPTASGGITEFQDRLTTASKDVAGFEKERTKIIQEILDYQVEEIIKSVGGVYQPLSQEIPQLEQASAQAQQKSKGLFGRMRDAISSLGKFVTGKVRDVKDSDSVERFRQSFTIAKERANDPLRQELIQQARKKTNAKSDLDFLYKIGALSSTPTQDLLKELAAPDKQPSTTSREVLSGKKIGSMSITDIISTVGIKPKNKRLEALPSDVQQELAKIGQYYNLSAAEALNRAINERGLGSMNPGVFIEKLLAKSGINTTGEIGKQLTNEIKAIIEAYPNDINKAIQELKKPKMVDQDNKRIRGTGIWDEFIGSRIEGYAKSIGVAEGDINAWLVRELKPLGTTQPGQALFDMAIRAGTISDPKQKYKNLLEKYAPAIQAVQTGDIQKNPELEKAIRNYLKQLGKTSNEDFDQFVKSIKSSNANEVIQSLNKIGFVSELKNSKAVKNYFDLDIDTSASKNLDYRAKLELLAGKSQKTSEIIKSAIRAGAIKQEEVFRILNNIASVGGLDPAKIIDPSLSKEQLQLGRELRIDKLAQFAQGKGKKVSELGLSEKEIELLYGGRVHEIEQARLEQISAQFGFIDDKGIVDTKDFAKQISTLELLKNEKGFGKSAKRLAVGIVKFPLQALGIDALLEAVRHNKQLDASLSQIAEAEAKLVAQEAIRQQEITAQQNKRSQAFKTALSISKQNEKDFRTKLSPELQAIFDNFLLTGRLVKTVSEEQQKKLARVLASQMSPEKMTEMHSALKNYKFKSQNGTEITKDLTKTLKLFLNGTSTLMDSEIKEIAGVLTQFGIVLPETSQQTLRQSLGKFKEKISKTGQLDQLMQFLDLGSFEETLYKDVKGIRQYNEEVKEIAKALGIEASELEYFATGVFDISPIEKLKIKLSNAFDTLKVGLTDFYTNLRLRLESIPFLGNRVLKPLFVRMENTFKDIETKFTKAIAFSRKVGHTVAKLPVITNIATARQEYESDRAKSLQYLMKKGRVQSVGELESRVTKGLTDQLDSKKIATDPEARAQLLRGAMKAILAPSGKGLEGDLLEMTKGLGAQQKEAVKAILLSFSDAIGLTEQEVQALAKKTGGYTTKAVAPFTAYLLKQVPQLFLQLNKAGWKVTKFTLTELTKLVGPGINRGLGRISAQASQQVADMVNSARKLFPSQTKGIGKYLFKLENLLRNTGAGMQQYFNAQSQSINKSVILKAANSIWGGITSIADHLESLGRAIWNTGGRVKTAISGIDFGGIWNGVKSLFKRITGPIDRLFRSTFMMPNEPYKLTPDEVNKLYGKQKAPKGTVPQASSGTVPQASAPQAGDPNTKTYLRRTLKDGVYQMEEVTRGLPQPNQFTKIFTTLSNTFQNIGNSIKLPAQKLVKFQEVYRKSAFKRVWDAKKNKYVGQETKTRDIRESQAQPLSNKVRLGAIKAAQDLSFRISQYFANSATRSQTAWDRAAQKIQGKNWPGMVKKAAQVGLAIVNTLNHGAADVTAAAWERTQHATAEDMQHMANNATVAGQRISGDMEKSAKKSIGFFRALRGTIGGFGKAGAGMFGAFTAAGFAAQTISFSLANMGIVGEETSQKLYKFFEIFTIISAVSSLAAPLMGAVTASVGALGSAIALLFNPVTLVSAAILGGLIAINYGLKKFYGIDLLGPVFEKAKAKLAYAIAWIQSAWQGFANRFGGILMPIIQPAINVAQSLISALNCDPTVRIPEAWEGAVGRIGEFIKGLPIVGQLVSGQLIEIFNPEKIFGGFFNYIDNIKTKITQLASGDLGKKVQAALPTQVQQAGGFLKKAFQFFNIKTAAKAEQNLVEPQTEKSKEISNTDLSLDFSANAISNFLGKIVPKNKIDPAYAMAIGEGYFTSETKKHFENTDSASGAFNNLFSFFSNQIKKIKNLIKTDVRSQSLNQTENLSKTSDELPPVKLDFAAQLQAASKKAQLDRNNMANAIFSELLEVTGGQLTAQQYANVITDKDIGKYLSDAQTETYKQQRNARIGKAFSTGISALMGKSSREDARVAGEDAKADLMGMFGEQIVMAEKAKEQALGAVTAFSLAWQDRMSYLSRTGGNYIGEMFEPGLEQAKAGWATLVDDAGHFAGEAFKSIIKLDFEGLKSAAADFGKNATAALKSIAGGFGSAALSAAAFGVFSLTSMSPMLLVMGGIALVGAAIATNFLGLRTITAGLLKIVWGLVTGLTAIVQALYQIGSGTIMAIQGILTLDFDRITDGAVKIFDAVEEAGFKLIDSLEWIFRGFAQTVVGVFQGVGQILIGPFARLKDLFLNFPTLVRGMGAAIVAALSAPKQVFLAISTAIDKFKIKAQTAAVSIASAIKSAAENPKAAWTSFYEFVSGIFRKLRLVMGSLRNPISLLSSGLAAASQAPLRAWQKVLDLLNTIGNKAQKVGEAVAGSAVGRAVRAVKARITGKSPTMEAARQAVDFEERLKGKEPGLSLGDRGVQARSRIGQFFKRKPQEDASQITAAATANTWLSWMKVQGYGEQTTAPVPPQVKGVKGVAPGKRTRVIRKGKKGDSPIPTQEFEEAESTISSTTSALGGLANIFSLFAPAVAAPLFAVSTLIDSFQTLKNAIPGLTKHLGFLAPVLHGIKFAAATTWAAISGPLLPFIIAIGAVAAGIGVLYLAVKHNFLGIGDLVGGVIGVFKEFFGMLFSGIGEEISGIFGTIASVAVDIGNSLKELGRAFFEPFVPILEMFGIKDGGSSLLKGAMQVIVQGLLIPFRLVATVLKAIVVVVGAIVKGAIGLATILTRVILSPITLFMYAVKGVFNITRAMATGLISLGANIVRFVLTPFQALWGIVSQVFNFIPAAFDFIKTAALSLMSSVWQMVPEPIRWLVEKAAAGVGFAASMFGGTQKDAETIPKYATGGLVTGNGTSTGDRILAAISPGEYVVNAAAVKENYATLEAINSGKAPSMAVMQVPPPRIPAIDPSTLPSSRNTTTDAEATPPIHFNFTFSGDIILQGSSGPEAASEFLDSLEPQLEQRVRQIMRRIAEFTK